MNISKPGSNQATFVHLQNIAYISQLLKLQTQLKLLDQSFFTFQAGYEIHQNYYFTQQFNRKIVQTLESGLINYWKSKYEVKKDKSDSSGPKVLSMNHLMIGFKIFLLCVLISVFIFISEIKYFKRNL